VGTGQEGRVVRYGLEADDAQLPLLILIVKSCRGGSTRGDDVAHHDVRAHHSVRAGGASSWDQGRRTERSLKRADETSETSPARRLVEKEKDLNQRDLTTACTTPLPARSQRAGALSVPILGPCAVRAALAPGWPSESAPSAITAPSNDHMKLTRHRRMSRRHRCRLRRTCRPKIGARPVSSP